MDKFSRAGDPQHIPSRAVLVPNVSSDTFVFDNTKKNVCGNTNVSGYTFTDKINAALALLDLSAPFIAPADLAPLFGISQSGVHFHCRAFKALRLWKGSYRFYTDDAEHMEILRGLIGRILRSGRRLPNGTVKRG